MVKAMMAKQSILFTFATTCFNSVDQIGGGGGDASFHCEKTKQFVGVGGKLRFGCNIMSLLAQCTVARYNIEEEEEQEDEVH